MGWQILEDYSQNFGLHYERIMQSWWANFMDVILGTSKIQHGTFQSRLVANGRIFLRFIQTWQLFKNKTRILLCLQMTKSHWVLEFFFLHELLERICSILTHNFST